MNFEKLLSTLRNINDTVLASTAHSINLGLTTRNWLFGCYIVEFEQRGEDKAAYGERLLQTIEQRLNTKGLNERRFRDFRRFYLTYPQLANSISTVLPIRQSPTAEFQGVPSELILNKLPYTHLQIISTIDDPLKRAFYEVESIKGC